MYRGSLSFPFPAEVERFLAPFRSSKLTKEFSVASFLEIGKALIASSSFFLSSSSFSFSFSSNYLYS